MQIDRLALTAHGPAFAHRVWSGGIGHVIGAFVTVRALETGDAAAFTDWNRVAGLALRMGQIAGSRVDGPMAAGRIAQTLGHGLGGLAVAVAGGRVDDDGAVAEFKG